MTGHHKGSQCLLKERCCTSQVCSGAQNGLWTDESRTELFGKNTALRLG